MNPKVATIVPEYHLEEIKDDEYMMALSYVAESESYVDWFAERGDGKYLILDNSAIELGDPEPFEEYMLKAIRMKADEIMLPDFFQEPGNTLEEAKRCMEIVRTTEMRFNIMVIPQGETVLEWFKNARDLLKVRSLGNDFTRGFWEATTVGISYRYTEMFGGNRVNMLWLLASILPNFQKVHLLGCGTSPLKEAQIALGYSHVRGIDSSYPCIYASHNLELTEHCFSLERPPRHIDFLDDIYEVDLLKQNMKVWRNACLNHSE